MDETDRRLAKALQMTKVVRPLKRHLETFGVTDLRYYVITEPSYSDLVPGSDESVIRDGKVVSQRPAIVTPTYMLNLEGFGPDATKYMQGLVHRYGPHSPGLLYQYRNEPGQMEIVGGQVAEVAQRIADDLDKRGEDRAAVVLGIDEFWDVSVLKLIYEYTAASTASNTNEIQAMGLLDPDPEIHVPRGVIQQIEELFHQVEGGLDPKFLQQELARWGLFDDYQDRFLKLFRRK